MDENERKEIETAKEKVLRKFEDEAFQTKITEMADNADKLIREYELERKKGHFDLEVAYPKALKIYEEIVTLLDEKGWKEPQTVYQNQITITQEKWQRDKELREIEEHKREKERIYQDSLKSRGAQKVDLQKMKAAEMRAKQEVEEKVFQKEITEMAGEAEKMIREYELERKKGRFDKEAPYQKAIAIYRDIKDQLLKRNWEEQTKIYINQIRILEDKLTKDKKLREIEEQKKAKDKIYQDSLKIRAAQKVDFQKMKGAEMRAKQEAEDKAFQTQINKMADEAEKVIREYELKRKKGIFDKEAPYQKAIEIYMDIKNQLLERNWKEQANIYTNQIRILQEKLAKDNKLRQIEIQKEGKEQDYIDSLKLSEVKSSKYGKIKNAQDKLKKEREDAKFQEKVNQMVAEAEKIIREYELAIKKGKFEEKPPYQDVIETYNEIRDQLLERNWKEQAIIYINQIRILQEKLANDKRLREFEAQKKIKDQEYLDSLKLGEVEGLHDEKIKAAQEKLIKDREDEKFQQEIDQMVAAAEKLIREYESEIKKGNFEIQPPYLEVVKTYEAIIEKLKNKGWKEQIYIYKNTVQILQEKSERDKKLRETEQKKKLKDKEYEELLKVKKEEINEEEKLKSMEKVQRKKHEEEEFEQKIAFLSSKADEMIRNYELEIRKKNISDVECVYPQVIQYYEEIREMLLDKKWNEQALVYSEQIKLIKQKIDNDNKLRELEKEKEKKKAQYEELIKTKSEDKVLEADIERIQHVEDQYKKELEEEEFENRIISMVDSAEKIVRKYELEIRRGNFEAKCAYPEAIKIYENIRQMLLDRGWEQEARIYSQSIKLLKEKEEKDKKLREIEAQKEIKEKRMEEFLKAPQITTPVQETAISEVDLIKAKEKSVSDESFSLIDRAERLVKEYELKLKFEKNILDYESPYEEAISLYRKARKIFQEQGWEKEASSLINTINFYKDKLSKDQNLRALERSKLEEAEVEKVITKFEPLTDKVLVEKQKKAIELEKQKREDEKLANKAFELIDSAERSVKNYELKLKDGVFPDSPYKKVIEMYRSARKIFEEVGWDDQAIKLINTINFYKDKMEADNKLRALEAEKIKKQQKELEEEQRYIEKFRKKQEEKLRLRQEALMIKQEQERFLEERKFKAYSLMDQANRELKNDNFDRAIEIYKESEKIFSEIEWLDGLRMAQESIIVIKKKKQDYEKMKEAIKEEAAEKARLEREIEEKIAKTKELEKLQQQLKREEILKTQKQKEKEMIRSKEAYGLLEEGTKLAEDKRFEEAHDKYITAQEIFTDIGWVHEVNRISTDLLVTLKNEEQNYKRYKEQERMKIEEEKEIEKMVLETEKQRKELEELSTKERRKKLIKLQISEKLKEKIKENYERANIEVKNFNYNKAIVMYKDIINMMKRIGWEREISEIKNQIHVLKNKSHVPLITVENLEEEENMDKFKSAYIALDRAHVSLLKNRLMKAISELNEAKYNLQETKTGLKYIDNVEKKIEQYKSEIEKLESKKDISDIVGIKLEGKKLPELSSELGFKYLKNSKNEEMDNNLEKAIEFANIAKKIFVKLGSEWSDEIMKITRFLDVLENKKIARQEALRRKKEELEQEEERIKAEEEEFKARLKARREERRKRIQKLMKSD
ncbi:MAG: hypothetical protein EU542_05220 [Promethearchaeota archaeon]|nr:MAG: hypothetical protein EU542_05220 [Candidatus Lokiarchaeota archaeon]